MTSENALCACGAPLTRAIGGEWEIYAGGAVGALLQKAVDEGWRWDWSEEAFLREGSLPCSLAHLRERFYGIDTSDEVRGGA